MAGDTVDIAEEISRLRRERDEAREEVERLKQTVCSDDQQIQSWQSKVVTLRAEVEKLRAKIADDFVRFDEDLARAEAKFRSTDMLARRLLDKAAQFERERDEAREKLADIEESWRKTMQSPCPDEQHCTCVPVLRAKIETALAIAMEPYSPSTDWNEIVQRMVEALTGGREKDEVVE